MKPVQKEERAEVPSEHRSFKNCLDIEMLPVIQCFQQSFASDKALNNYD